MMSDEAYEEQQRREKEEHEREIHDSPTLVSPVMSDKTVQKLKKAVLEVYKQLLDISRSNTRIDKNTHLRMVTVLQSCIKRLNEHAKG
jgi:hypothetical protein